MATPWVTEGWAGDLELVGVPPTWTSRGWGGVDVWYAANQVETLDIWRTPYNHGLEGMSRELLPQLCPASIFLWVRSFQPGKHVNLKTWDGGVAELQEATDPKVLQIDLLACAHSLVLFLNATKGLMSITFKQLITMAIAPRMPRGS